jgi:maltose alpha-D-glucosyltransferase/alpha-amylase
MGDNIYLGDRNGVRTPMQWSGDRNAGFSDANPQRLYLPAIIDPEYHFGTVNVEAQQANPNSLLWWMKRIIALRKRYQAFGRGTIRFFYPDNRKVLAFLREFENERILVVVNLSRMVQHITLDLSEFDGVTPVELFGRTEFPSIGKEPFFLTLGGHSFYWFELTPAAAEATVTITDETAVPSLRAASIEELAGNAWSSQAERVFREYIRAQRWYRSKARSIREVSVAELIPLDIDDVDAAIAIILIEYPDGEPDRYVLPLMRVSEARVHELKARVICKLRESDERCYVIDASFAPEFANALLALVKAKRRISTGTAAIEASALPPLRELLESDSLEPRLLGAEQSNSSTAFGTSLVLKLYRKLDDGRSLDLEVGEFLTRKGFPHTPAMAGFIDYEQNGRESTLAVANAFTPNEGDAWQYTIDTLGGFFERAATREEAPPHQSTTTRNLLRLARTELPTLAREVIGPFVEDARLIGQRTAELHNALSSDPGDAAFAPEPFTIFYQRSLYN